MTFNEIDINELQFNPFTLVRKEWFLIAAGNAKKCNTMTASWGSMGFIWQKNAITIYVRPQRYTKEFIDLNSVFTVSFFDKQYKPSLNICGCISGRNELSVASFRCCLTRDFCSP